MTQLTGQDASFLYVENDTLKSHFTILTIYDQSMLKRALRYRDILKYFDSRIAGLPVFRRKLFRVPLELDAPYFADDPNFNIESHVRHIGLPKPGDWRQFCILAAQIHAVPIDTSKPLWDMHVIEGLDNIEGMPLGSFAILTRLHHAIADGTTARGILMALHHPKGQPPKVLKPAASEPPPTLTNMLIRGSINNARQLSAIPRRVANLVPVAGPMLGRVAAGAVEKLFASDKGGDKMDRAGINSVPKTIFNGDMEYRRVFQLRRYSLDAIKRLRELAPDSTLNDVVLTLIGGGLRRYLEASGEKQDIDLAALCPINLREDKMSNDSTQGNNISLMQINLNTRTSTPGKRLAKVVGVTTQAKLAQKASTAKEIIALSSDAPNLLLALGTRLAMHAAFREGNALRLSNCIITNVPGPQEPLYFMGARMELFNAVAPISPGTGITFPVTSYCGQLCISFTACSSWVQDPQRLAQCLDDSFADMLAAVRSKVPNSPVRKRPATSRNSVVVAKKPSLLRQSRAKARRT